MCSERGCAGCWTGSSPARGGALGHRGVPGVFPEMVGETPAAFCGLVLGRAGNRTAWRNGREMGRNGGRKGNRAINSSQKGQNVCCAKNTQPQLLILHFTAVALSYFKMMNGRGSDTDLLGEVWRPKGCRGSRENSGHGEHLQGEVHQAAWWGSVTALSAWGETSAAVATPVFEGLSRCGFTGNQKGVEGRAVHGGAHHPTSVGCREPLGRRLPRACRCTTETRSVQGLSL